MGANLHDKISIAAQVRDFYDDFVILLDTDFDMISGKATSGRCFVSKFGCSIDQMNLS